MSWWKRTTVYQIYPRSFFDSNGDGIGDLPGIVHKLDYLQSLGVETLWLSPVFASPQADFGYDISDYFSLAPEYGTLRDYRRLVDAVHGRGMRLVMDLVLNHTSDAHPWFEQSRGSRDNPKRDWYIWRDGHRPHGRAPPNNWKSVIGCRGWHHDAQTDQWYYASCLPFQPDLNYRNPEVKTQMLGVVRHWLEQGVDGLRLDLFGSIYKDASFTDNPFSWRPIPSEHNPDGFFQRPVHTLNHPDTLAFARELRSMVDGVGGPPRLLVGEVTGPTPTLRAYCAGGSSPAKHRGLHLVFLFKSLATRFNAPAFRALIEENESAFPDPLMPTYVFGNHDRPRSGLRLGNDERKAKLLAALQLTVRGVPFVYYGDEIGLPNDEIPLRRAQDPIAGRYKRWPQFMANCLRRFGILLNRDEARLPMAWDAGQNAGFCAPGASAWLPPPHGPGRNVEAQLGDPTSLLACYRRLLELRQRLPALHRGGLELLERPRLPKHVLAYRRSCSDDAARADVLLNFGARTVQLGADAVGGVRVFSSDRGWTDASDDRYALAPFEAVVLTS